MGNAFGTTGLLAVGLALASSQLRGAESFDVTSVKITNEEPGSSGILLAHGRLEATNVTLRRCITRAYGVSPSQILGGPGWLTTTRFDIIAKASQRIEEESVLMSMFQSLLEERFKLKLRKEIRTMKALSLEIGRKGPKLRKGTAEAADGAAETLAGDRQISIVARATAMPTLAKLLGRYLGRPVLDGTKLSGVYDFRLAWTPAFSPDDPEVQQFGSIYTAIRDQLGLELRSTKASVGVLYIDHVEQAGEN